MHNFLYAIGAPLSPVYSLLMRIRARLYQKKVFRCKYLPVPVISVGNLTLGGTGKTPMVISVVKSLQRAGYKPAVVSRGYGGAIKEPVNVVSDGKKIQLSPEMAGDEAVLLADNLPGVPVLTGRIRSQVGKFAVDGMKADIIVLDDGFQHLALHRDLNLVLFNSCNPIGNGKVFPGGELREPLTALKRAHAFIITGNSTGSVNIEGFKAYLQQSLPSVPVFFGKYQVTSLVNGTNDRIMAMAEARRLRLLGFCGLARPESFQLSLQQEQLHVTDFVRFGDHHRYRIKDIKRLAKKAKGLNCDGLITTEKDFVKLKAMPHNFPIYILKARLSLDDDFESFLTDFVCPA